MNNLLNINQGRAIKIFAMIVLLDFITGVVRAIVREEFNLNDMFMGILKKVGYIVLIILCHMVDILFNTGGEVRLMSIMFLSGIDGISILENLRDLGVPIPDRIKSIFNSFSKIIIAKNRQNEEVVNNEIIEKLEIDDK